MAPTYYVDDYDGKKNSDAVDRERFEPVSSTVDPDRTFAKVVEPENAQRPAKKTSRAKTKG